jgi:hypothetical protein
MLVFSQDSDTVTLVNNSTGTLTSNTGTLTPTAVNGTNCTASSFSRPVAAVFSSDDTTAYVLSSGAINGGTQPGGTQPATPMVTVLDMTQSPPACLQTIPVSGANVGLLVGTQLYVAGAQFAACSSGSGQCQQGILSVIDTSANTVASVPFGPIAPNLLPGVLTFDGTNLWIGSTGCQVTAVGAPGCLSLYFPATGQALASGVPCVSGTGSPCSVLTDQTDDITGMVWLQPFNGRTVMYIIEGGRLVPYNSSTTSLPTIVNTLNNSLDIVGTAVDVKAAK